MNIIPIRTGGVDIGRGDGGGLNYTVNTESKFYWLREAPPDIYLERRLHGASGRASALDVLARIRSGFESLRIATSADTAHEP